MRLVFALLGVVLLWTPDLVHGLGCTLTKAGCPIHVPLHGTLSLADGRTGVLRGALTRSYHYDSSGRFTCRGEACPARRGHVYPCSGEPAEPCDLDLSFHSPAQTYCRCKGIDRVLSNHRSVLGGDCTCSAKCAVEPCPPVLPGSHAEVIFTH